VCSSDLQEDPGVHLSLRMSGPQGLSAAGRGRSFEKSSNLIGNRICDLPACSIMPQLTTLTRAPGTITYKNKQKP
jgi:hypothetical protein